MRDYISLTSALSDLSTIVLKIKVVVVSSLKDDNVKLGTKFQINIKLLVKC